MIGLDLQRRQHSGAQDQPGPSEEAQGGSDRPPAGGVRRQPEAGLRRSVPAEGVRLVVGVERRVDLADLDGRVARQDDAGAADLGKQGQDQPQRKVRGEQLNVINLNLWNYRE